MSFEAKKVRRDIAAWWRVDVSGRFLWDLRLAFKRDSAGEYARSDLSHAYVNMFVEFQRATAYLVGHVMAIFWPWLLIALVWK